MACRTAISDGELWLAPGETEASSVRIVLAITTLIFGPLDVVEAVIFKPGIFEMIFAMSEDNILQQKVVCECIVAAVTKYKKASVFICRSVNILENLYQSKDDSIRIPLYFFRGNNIYTMCIADSGGGESQARTQAEARPRREDRYCCCITCCATRPFFILRTPPKAANDSWIILYFWS
ncbi:hypothetical protein DBV15_06177 [Temnothorax longispinosus]|uniref:UNC-45/Cro1/She4 central domain-containing protein n=1 Tax=Temnothorax longispinosus TaxID=300112 RepID=A0A4S2JL38_9HYME|nr:hypothetical protein DBV15_06177 [Temnothorax longispinosus]